MIKCSRLRLAGLVEEGRGTFKTLTGKPAGKRPLERAINMYQYEELGYIIFKN